MRTMMRVMLSFGNTMPKLTFAEQIIFPNFQDNRKTDLNEVFFNADNFEFATVHTIVTANRRFKHECWVVVDTERYFERMIRDKVQGVSKNGLVFFIKTSEWLEKFQILPGVGEELYFDGEDEDHLYLVSAVSENMGSLEVTLESYRGSF